jgi:hypothetical protein
MFVLFIFMAWNCSLQELLEVFFFHWFGLFVVMSQTTRFFFRVSSVKWSKAKEALAWKVSHEKIVLKEFSFLSFFERTGKNISRCEMGPPPSYFRAIFQYQHLRTKHRKYVRMYTVSQPSPTLIFALATLRPRLPDGGFSNQKFIFE